MDQEEQDYYDVRDKVACNYLQNLTVEESVRHYVSTNRFSF